MTRDEWKTKITALEGDIRGLKALRNASGQPDWTWKHARNLTQHKAEATALYALRAQLRRRLHDPRRWPTLDEQQAMLAQRGLWPATLPPTIVLTAAGAPA